MFAAPFFHLAAVSPTRQQTFRGLVSAHIAILGLMIAGMLVGGTLTYPMVMGSVLLTLGIVEGRANSALVIPCSPVTVSSSASRPNA